MKTSPAGRALIQKRESRRLVAYRDSRNIWTIGVGHAATGLPPKPYAGMTITEAQCDALLAADLAPVEATINAAVTVPMTQNEFDAMASLGFNIGVAGLKRSSVVRLLNKGDVQGAGKAFMAWSKPSVLMTRRTVEMAQFLQPDAIEPGSVARTKAFADRRGAALATKAATAKVHGNTAQTVSGALAAGATVTASTVAHSGHLHAGLWAGGIVFAGALAAGVVAYVKHAAAITLSSNAVHQPSGG